jgi:hypothetical protein
LADAVGLVVLWHLDCRLSGRWLDLLRGGLISSGPIARAGDSTPWYASFWEFCALLQRPFRRGVASGAGAIAFASRRENGHSAQVVVSTPKGTNNTINLLFGTSLYDLKVSEMAAATDLAVRDSLRLFSPVAALVRVPESFFARNPIEVQVMLGSLADASDLLRLLLNGGHSAKAGYLAGAFRATDRPKLSDEIVSTMKSAGYDVRESNPFEAGQTFGAPSRAVSPICRTHAHDVGIDARRSYKEFPGGTRTAEGQGRLSAFHR